MSNNYIEYQVRVYPNRTEWRKGDKLHREGAPAVEHTDGSKFWYQNGQFHRNDGPACEYANGKKYWYQNGQCHRDDGPACEYADGTKSWYIEGKRLSEEEFLKQTQPDPCEGKIVEIEGKKYRLTSV